MTKFVLESNITSSANLIFLSGEDNQIRSEVAFQLTLNKNLTVLDNFKYLINLNNIFPEVIIYFAPYIFSKRNDIKYLNHLPCLLQLALKYNSHFILVLNDNSLSSRQALKYTLQFVKQKHITINIVEVDHGVTPKIMAQSIIRLFIYNHHLISNLLPLNTDNSSKSTGTLCINKPGKINIIITKLFLYSLSVLLGYLISILLQISVITLSFNRGIVAFNKSDYSQSSRYLYFAGSVADAFISNVNILLPRYYINHILGIPADKTIGAIRSISELTSYLSGIDHGIYNVIYSSNTDSLKINLSDLKNEANLLDSYINRFKTEVILANQSYSGQRLIPDSVINSISTLETLVPKLNYLILQLPQLLGYGKPITYLFLLQDNSSLFPTGGEIDSVVTLSLNNGKVFDFQIHPSSDLDRLFTGTSIPPPDYQNLTGQLSWLFSQNTWNPDFFVTANVVAKHVSKALGVKPDVVIGLNLLTLKNIIPSLKHLTFSVNGSFLTSDNFINKYLELADNRKNISFIRETLSHIQYQTPVFTSDNFGIFLQNIFNQLDSRQIFIQPTDNILSSDILADWSGKINAPVCRSYWPCLHGFLYMSDARLSGSPSYFRLSQKNTLDIRISDDVTDYILKTAVINTEDAKNTQTSIAHIYRTVFLSANIQLLSANVNDKEIVPERLQFINNSDIQQLGFSLNIPAQTESILEIRYREFLPQSNNKFRLQIDIPNQPGLIDSSYDINLIYPPSWFATSFRKPRVASPGTLRYNTPISQPIHLDIDFFKR